MFTNINVKNLKRMVSDSNKLIPIKVAVVCKSPVYLQNKDAKLYNEAFVIFAYLQNLVNL